MSTSKSMDIVKSLTGKAEKFDLAKTLEQKLDIGYEIYNEISNVLNLIPDNDEAKPFLVKLNNNALEFMSILLNTLDIEEIINLAERRKRMVAIDPAFLPRSKDIAGVGELDNKPVYQFKRLINLAMAYNKKIIMRVNDESRKVDQDLRIMQLKYEERAKHRVVLTEGLFFKPVEDRELLKGDLFEGLDTSNMSSHGNFGYAAYVINTYGEISVFNHYGKADQYAHSSMNAGAAVFSAGEMRVEDGELKEINTYSGHYAPALTNAYEVLKFFREQKCEMQDVQVMHYVVKKIQDPDSEIIPGCIDYFKEVKSSNQNTELVVYCMQADDILKWGDEAVAIKAEEQQKHKLAKIKNYEEIGLNILLIIFNEISMEIDECLKSIVASSDIVVAAALIKNIHSVMSKWRAYDAGEVKSQQEIVQALLLFKNKLKNEIRRISMAMMGDIDETYANKLHDKGSMKCFIKLASTVFMDAIDKRHNAKILSAKLKIDQDDTAEPRRSVSSQ